jgi:AhpC/TSA antioxidant enzyme
VKVLHSRQRLAAAGGEAVFVVHDPPDRVRAGILAELSVPWPVLVDPDRDAYHAWGLGRARLAAVWLSPALWARYARLLASGERLRRLGRDTLQLGGDFVVDLRGRIAYARPQRRDDGPPVGELLGALERAAPAASRGADHRAGRTGRSRNAVPDT